MTHNFTPYTPPKPLTEKETIERLTKMVEKEKYGRDIYEVSHVRTLLDIINRQEKEIRHCKKYLNRMIAWKNKFWLSVRRIEHCDKGRQLGLQGRQVFGYSVRLRVLGKEVI